MLIVSPIRKGILVRQMSVLSFRVNTEHGMVDNMAKKDDPRFENCPVSRRQFLRLSAVTSGSLLLPGIGVAQEIESEKFTPLYEFVVNHTPRNQQVQTLVRLNDPSAFQQLENLGITVDTDTETEISIETTQEPELAAYLEPTPTQIENLAEIEAVNEVLFSPGANPFWRLQDYEDRVFPPVEESVGFLDFEEMVQGMNYLVDQHPNRIQLKTIGESVGRYNIFTHEIEPQNIWIAELTNDVTDASSFAEKEKLLVFNHDSDERQGPEALFRFIEDILIGNESGVESLLDELAFIFMISNPDGWVSKHPQYYSGAEAEADDVVISNEFRTDLASGADPNRSYPTPGFMSPENYPAEAAGSNLKDDDPGVDSDVPDYIADTVPGELDVTEYFRTRDYQNLNYGIDLHGFGASDTFIEGFPLNGDYDYADLQDIYSLQESIDAAIEESNLEELITRESLQSTFERLNEQMAEEGEEAPPIPEQTYNFGTLFDVLGYSTSGDGISWMSASRENGGLGDIKTFATETVYSIGEYIPELVQAWVVANTTVIRTTAQHVVSNVESSVDTGGASTAYVVSDTLTRSSRDLSFNTSASGGQSTYKTTSKSTALTPSGTEQVAINVAETTQQLVVTAPGAGGIQLELVTPTGDVVQSQRFADHPTGFGSSLPTVTRTVDTAGDWQVRITNLRNHNQDIEMTIGRLQSEGENPNPRDVLEFSQRDYTVSPFAFFREHEGYLTQGDFEAVTVEDVQNGVLMGEDGPAFENVVVIHSDGSNSQRYVSSVDEYVGVGGNLVLTDQGVHLLSALSNQLAEPFTTDDITDETLFTSFLGDRNDDHLLLEGTESSQLEVGKWIPLGYSLSGDAPMTLVAPETFQGAGGSVAATTSGEYEEITPGVAAGSLTQSDSQTGIHIIGGLLPPATQNHLHPFGMNDYSISNLGMMLMMNALGYTANVSVNSG